MRKMFVVVAHALAVIAFAAGTLALVNFAVAGEQLNVTSWGGPYQAALRKVLFEPFSRATGVNITDDEFSGEVSKIRAMVETKTVSWDAVDVSGGMALQMCAEGIIEPIDWKKLGLDPSKFVSADKQECGIPSKSSATVLAYDKDKLPNGPKTIADLFDTKKFLGKRGLWKSPSGILEWALVADGVPINDVYTVLSTSAGVDRAFKKLDTIKKDIVWWTAGAQAPQLLGDGQVVMTAAFNGRIYDAVKTSGKHFDIVWDAAIVGWDYWVIPKGSSRRDDAYKFLAFVGSPLSQASLTQYFPYGPANKEAMAHVDPSVLPDLPNSHWSVALETNPAFWRDKGGELRERFNLWLTK